MPITNSTQHSSIYGWNGSSWERVEVNSGNQLEVEVKNTAPISVTTDISGQYVNVANNTDPATSTKQDAGNTLLTDIKTNTTQEAGAFSYSKALPVVLTTYEGGASLNAVGSQSGNVKVYIDDANPDFVVNSGMATGAKQDAQTALLSSMDGKITACDTNAVVVLSSALPSGAATSALQTSGNASLSSMDGKITACNTDAVIVSSVVQTAAADVNNKGSYGNVANNVTINSGAQSGSADIADMNNVSLVYQDTATSSIDGLDVLVSGDGVNYDTITQLYPTTNTAGTIRYAYYQASLGGLTDIKIENTSSTDNYTNVKCSVWGCPN